MRTVLFLVWKETLQVLRDPAMLFQIFFIPAVQLLVIVNAATFEVQETRVYLDDEDRTPASRLLAGQFAASPRFAVQTHSTAPNAAADRSLLMRRSDLILRIPDGFARGLVTSSQDARVQLVVSAEGASAGTARAYAQQVIQRFATQRTGRIQSQTRRAAAGSDASSRIDVRNRFWYNQALSYDDFMAPGILALLVTLVGTLLTAQNIAREKELGTLEQLNVTPITKGQFIAGKLLPFWVLGLIELAVGLGLAKLFFDIPVRGTLALVFLAAAIYLVAALGVGLWISSAAETQQQAMFMTFFVMVIYLFLSGLFTPVSSMPSWVQPLAEVNPVKHFVTILRAVLMKGAELRDLLRPLGVLALFAAVILPLAMRQYSKTSG